MDFASRNKLHHTPKRIHILMAHTLSSENFLPLRAIDNFFFVSSDNGIPLFLADFPFLAIDIFFLASSDNGIPLFFNGPFLIFSLDF